MYRLFIFSLLMALSCRQTEAVVIEYHKNGNPKITQAKSHETNIVCSQHFSEERVLERLECKLDEGTTHTLSFENYFENGKVRRKGTLINGLKQGSFIAFYNDGHKFEELNYLNDELHGKQFNYREDGSIRAINYFDNGNLIYKKIENQDNVEFESLKPIVDASLDSSRNELLNLRFDVPSELLDDEAEYFIHYDVQRISLNGGAAPFPKNEFKIVEIPIEVDLKMSIDAEYWLYGFISKETKDTLVQYDTFERQLLPIQ